MAIGHGQGHTIDQYANAAHAEIAPCAKPANRRAQALSQVVTIEAEHAWHARQQSIQREVLLTGRNARINNCDGGRRVQPARSATWRSDQQWRQFNGSLG